MKVLAAVAIGVVVAVLVTSALVVVCMRAMPQHLLRAASAPTVSSARGVFEWGVVVPAEWSAKTAATRMELSNWYMETVVLGASTSRPIEVYAVNVSRIGWPVPLVERQTIYTMSPANVDEVYESRVLARNALGVAAGGAVPATGIAALLMRRR